MSGSTTELSVDSARAAKVKRRATMGVPMQRARVGVHASAIWHTRARAADTAHPTVLGAEGPHAPNYACVQSSAHRRARIISAHACAAQLIDIVTSALRAHTFIKWNNRTILIVPSPSTARRARPRLRQHACFSFFCTDARVE